MGAGSGTSNFFFFDTGSPVEILAYYLDGTLYDSWRTDDTTDDDVEPNCTWAANADGEHASFPYLPPGVPVILEFDLSPDVPGTDPQFPDTTSFTYLNCGYEPAPPTDYYEFYCPNKPFEGGFNQDILFYREGFSVRARVIDWAMPRQPR